MLTYADETGVSLAANGVEHVLSFLALLGQRYTF
jgi:hypothetical protein